MDETAAFKPATVEEIQELQRQSDDVYRNRLAGTEKASLDDYTTGTHDYINPLLYGTVTTYRPAEQTKYRGDIGRIDTAMGKFDLKQPVVVYSGTEAQWYSDWKAGEVRPVDAYLSTAVAKQASDKYYNDVKDAGKNPLMLEIYVPKDAKCIYIGANTACPNGNEYEFLLGRGQKYRVIERTENLMRLEAVP